MTITRRGVLATLAVGATTSGCVSFGNNTDNNSNEEYTGNSTDNSIKYSEVTFDVDGSISIDYRPEITVPSGEYQIFRVGPHPNFIGPNHPDSMWAIQNVMTYVRPVEDATSGTHRMEFLTYRTPASQFRAGRLQNDYTGHIRLTPAYVEHGEWLDDMTISEFQSSFNGLVLDGSNSRDAVEYIYRNNTDADYNPTPDEVPDDEIRIACQAVVLSK